MSTAPAIDDQKKALRPRALALRDAIPPDERAAAAEAIAARPLPVAAPPGAVVSGFFPLKGEINPLPLMRCFVQAGARLALPVVAGRGQPLTMRAFAFGDHLDTGVWGIREPSPNAPELIPDIVIVPLLAFDRRGHRLGYGAGYYDMTLLHLRRLKPITAIGIAFAAQEVETVPVTPHDEPLDLVLTERETISASNRRRG